LVAKTGLRSPCNVCKFWNKSAEDFPCNICKIVSQSIVSQFVSIDEKEYWEIS